MLAPTLKRLKYQINNLVVITLACLSIAPLTSLLTMKHTGKIESLVAIFCLAYWGLRQLFYFFTGLIYHQDTLYLWSLHTFSRVDSCQDKRWSSFFWCLFKQKHFLVLGNKQSGKSALLKNAGATEQQAPFEYQQKGLITHSVWAHGQHTLLESTALMPHNQETGQLQKKYWRNLINLNKWHHTMSGFDGIVVVISIHNILNEKKSHPTQSLDALRSQIKNVTGGSRDIPLFIVLSGLDSLPGFRTFFRHIDKEDIDKPLGFIIPRELQYSSDMQTELDKVANDIEMYLVYQLEKIIHGEHNDVEKMHVFHESFKSLKPKLVQLLFGFTTHIQNPVASILFTSHCERDVPFDTSSTQQIDRFYQNSTKHFFSRNLLDTISNNVSWQPSIKLQQYALIIIGLFAWNVSDLSVTHNILDPLQGSIQLLFSSRDSSVDHHEHSHAPQLPKKNRKQVLTERPLQLPSSPSPVVSSAQNTVEKQTSKAANVRNVIATPETSIWDLTKQTLDQKLAQCDVIGNSKCRSLAQLLLHIKKTSAVTANHISKISALDHFFKQQTQQLPVDTFHLDADKLAEVDYMLTKLRHNQPNITFSAASWSLLNQTFPEFVKLSLSDKIASSTRMVTETCDVFRSVSNVLPFDQSSYPACNQQLSSEIMHQLYHSQLKQHQTALKDYHNEKTIEAFLKKSSYLYNNTQIIVASMTSITQNMQDLSQQQHLFTAPDQRKLRQILDQTQAFDEKTYKLILEKIIRLSKNILESKDHNLAALQVLETLVNIEKDQSFWPKPWSQLDPFSQNCIRSYEQVIVDLSSQYLDSVWHKKIVRPFEKQLKPHYPFNEHSSSDCSLDDFDAFFSSKGIVPMFINKYLYALMEINPNSGAKWKSLHGRPLPFNTAIPHFIMGSNILQKMFYPNNAPSLWFEGVLRYRHGHEKIQSIEVIQDGNKQVIQVKQNSPVHIKWPYAHESFEIAVNLSSGERSVLMKEQGSWSMIRLLHHAKNDDHSRKNHLLTLSHLGLALELEFESQNIVTPLSSKMQNFFQVPDKITTK